MFFVTRSNFFHTFLSDENNENLETTLFVESKFFCFDLLIPKFAYITECTQSMEFSM